MNKLAIVIPAYKNDFFHATLDSLSRQTCKDFTVYIGDDCSPYNIESMVREYEKHISIVYHRFPENLGGTDLVAQWTRCINLTKNEPWLWLFSDDDIIGDKCVELFYRELNKTYVSDIYHFNVKIIDSKDKIVFSPNCYPDVIDIEKLYTESSTGNIKSFVVENIFSREIYNKVNGFEPFPLAWGSDMATWIKMAKEKGMKTIYDDYVYWRRSDKNITPNNERKIIKKKFYTQIDFYVWINNFFATKKMHNFNRYVFFRYCVHYSNILKFSDIMEISNYAINRHVISHFQKYSTTLVLPFLRVAQYVKSKMIRK